ncbi:MAG: hypothetical protein KGM44_00215 [bacterium]|nr:hypothetical protein [bacterium]
MTNDELHELATRYLGHLMTNPQARAEYTAVDKSDYSAIAQLVQKHLGLPQAPTKDDVRGMLQHGEELVKPLLDAMKQHSPEHYEMMLAGVIIGSFNK